MTWLRRFKPALYLLGLGLFVGSLVGATALMAGNNTTAPTKSAAPTAPVKAAGPVVMGTVDSDPPPVAYGLPPVLQSGTVAKVFVKDGETIKAGEPLYSFDTSIQSRDLERATIAIQQADNEVARAKEGKLQHEKKVAVLVQAVEAAQQKVTTAASLYNLVKKNIEDGLKNSGTMLSTEQLAEKLSKNPDLFRANSDYVDALTARDRLQAELDLVKATNVQLLIRQAEIAVDQAKAERDKAQTALDLCTVIAKTDGMVEQVKISPGATLGISTRDPALWLVPAGTRVVRAEVEADFAHRIGPDLIDKDVAILDHTDPSLTYVGKVLRVGGTFLPKRSESLLQSDTRVLEVLVVVSDPSPAGKPPLRVGQRVRVNLGR